MPRDLPDVEFWCLQCQDYIVMKPIKIITMKNGRKAFVGKCPEHRSLIYRFIRE